MHYKQYQQIQMRKNRCCLSIALLLFAGFESRGLAFFKSKYCNNNQRMSWQSHNEHHDETKHPIFCCSVCVFFIVGMKCILGHLQYLVNLKVHPILRNLQMQNNESFFLIYPAKNKKKISKFDAKFDNLSKWHVPHISYKWNLLCEDVKQEES